MKKLLTVMLCLAMLLSMAACGGGKQGGDTPSGGNTLDGTYDLTIWVSESDGVKELTQKQVEAFMSANPGIKINATIEGVTEADSATLMITDVESGADIYCFAQDQLARLVMANALNALGTQASATVKELNDEISVGAATVNGQLYCYPMTSDNGYYMYYDKSVVKEEHLDSLEDIIADCEAANKLFSMELETSAWYNASFFFATGCKSEWTTDSAANFTGVNDTFDSPEGLIALKGMQKLLKSPAYNSSSGASDFGKGSAVVVSGPWASADVQAILGANYGATDLPSFTVDGKSYHLGSFSGNKLMGVKPQTDAKKGAVCQQLALFLTNEECQLQRFELKGWGPSNKKAQENEAVKNDVALNALAAQNEYAVPQGQIHGSWWGIATNYAAAAKTATTDAELEEALHAYKAAIDGLFSLEGYIFVGAWNGWDNADTGMSMEKNNESYTITVDVPQSDYMGGRIVAAGNWDTDKGCQQVTEGADLIQPYDEASNADNNIIFLNPGKYTVTYNASSGDITIVAQ